MSDWTYVTIAYVAVWGSLAVYALFLTRRVAQAREVARRLRESSHRSDPLAEGDNPVCDAPPAP